MTKGIRIATIVMGAAWLGLAAGCSEPPNRPAAQLSAEPATQPAFDMGKLDLGDEDSNLGPPSKFYGSTEHAYHIVYVVDRSGSMAPTFQEVQFELLKSISKLHPTQDFSIIFFSGDGLNHGPQKRLALASPENKIAASNFIKDTSPSGCTMVLSALKHAFRVLKQADANKPGRVIFLLSDGDFAGMAGGSQYTTPDGKALNGNAAVIQWLRDNNPKEEEKGRVHVCTFLYLNRDPEPIKVMETIAKENAGRFKLITTDE